MTTTTSPDLYLAFHEAGHCWGLWLVNRRFRYATLRPRTPGFNAMTVTYRKWWFDELDILAIVAACGPAAEMWARRERNPEGLSPDEIQRAVEAGAQSDMPKCASILRDSDRAEELLAMMHGCWEGITQVAMELVERRTIQGDRVFEILGTRAPGLENPLSRLHLVGQGF